MANEITTPKGAHIKFQYEPIAEHLKAGFVSDHLNAFENGKKVGYLKIDRIDEELFKKECPDIWAYQQEYEGKHMFSDASQPISKKPFDELVRALRSGFMAYHITYWAKELKWKESDIKTLNDIAQQYDTPTSQWLEYDDLVRKFFIEWINTSDGKTANKRRKEKIQHSTKPFVAYISVEENRHQGLDANNQGRGIGMALYLEGAKWIKDRGLAKGLYASSIQSAHAKAIWDKLEKQGLVVKDGKRKYLKG